eukprot:161439_1
MPDDFFVEVSFLLPKENFLSVSSKFLNFGKTAVVSVSNRRRTKAPPDDFSALETRRGETLPNLLASLDLGWRGDGRGVSFGVTSSTADITRITRILNGQEH